MHVDLDLVPLRDSTLSPEEILMSESQERMCAVVEPANVAKFLEICAKWDVLATVIGDVIEGDRLLIDWHGERVVDVDPGTVAHEGPVYDRPIERPWWIDDLNARSANFLPRASEPDDLAATLLKLVRRAQPGRQVVGDRPVRPLRARQLDPRPAGELRHAPHR